MPSERQFFPAAETFTPTDPSGEPRVTLFETSFSNDWSSSGVKRKKPPRWKAPTAYSRSFTRVYSGLAVHLRYEQRRRGSQKGYIRDFFGDFLVRAPNRVMVVPEPTTYQALLNEALKGMVDSKFNLLTSIAEFRKTAEHLASTAERLTRAVVDVKRGRFSRAASHLGIGKPKGASRSKTWANNWLEYKYGWMPLVMDAYGIAQHLATLMRDEAPIFMSRKRRSARVQLPDQTGYDRSGNFRVDYRRRDNQEVRQQVCIYYQVDFAALDNLNRLGLLDPGATMWETVPFSFVADWFIPIGDWLSQANAWRGLTYMGGCYTVTKRSQMRIDMTASRCTSQTEAMISDFGEQVRACRGEYFTMHRSVITDPYYRMQLKSPVSFDHAITAIALLRQQFR